MAGGGRHSGQLTGEPHNKNAKAETTHCLCLGFLLFSGLSFVSVYFSSSSGYSGMAPFWVQT